MNLYFVISPAKDMKAPSLQVNKSIPCFIDKSKQLLTQLQQLSVVDIMQNMKVNEKIAILNHERFAHFAFNEHGQAAIDTYNGLQFKQLAINTYNQEMLNYMNDHLRILSGLYGVLKPFDSIYPYRLEMNYRPFDLYHFWRQDVKNYFQNKIVINIASNEYGDLLEGKHIYQVVFKIIRNGKLVVQSTQAKIARGKFIDYIIKKQISALNEIRSFSEDGYVFNEALSDEHVFVFVKGVLYESID